jgi:GT2 family glycosyltransferase
MTERIHVLLPVHNRKETTRRFVECLRAQTYSNFHLILIDDGSTDATAEMVLESIPGATVIRGTGAWWWAGSLQQGLDRLRQLNPAPSDVVLFINDDVAFAPDFLSAGIRILRENQDSLLLARIRDPETGGILESGVHADVRHLSFVTATQPDRINCLSTKGLFARWAVVELVGDFHPRILPHYLSDYEWTMRASRRGIRCITDPRLVLDSPNRGASGYWDFTKVDELREYLKLVFSNKSHANPFYWSCFVLLTSDWPVIPYRIARVWVRFLGEVFRRALPH